MLGLVFSWLALAPILLLLAAGAQARGEASSPETLREAEIATCRPGEQQTWGDGRDQASPARAWRFVYRHTGAPAQFSPAQVLQALQRAAAAWAPCGLPVQVLAAEQAGMPDPAQTLVQVDWDAAGARGHFGLADVGRRRLSLGAAGFELLRQRNPAHPALQTLQMTISHEMGHFLGLMAHSRRCVDVMSYYHDGRGKHCSAREPALMKHFVEYRSSLPTACDIARCRAINGLSGTP